MCLRSSSSKVVNGSTALADYPLPVTLATIGVLAELRADLSRYVSTFSDNLLALDKAIEAAAAIRVEHRPGHGQSSH